MTKKILVVRRDNIGDLLCTTPLIRSLRLRHPEARIDAFVNSYNAPVLAGNPDLDHVYAYTKAKHRAAGETVLGVHLRRLQLMLTLRRTRYDWVILAGDGNVERQLGLVRWLKPGQIIGFAAGAAAAKALDLPVPRRETGHEAERTHALLEVLGIAGPPPAMVLHADAALRQQAAQLLADVGGSEFAGPTIALHISARKEKQRWPVAAFAELARRLHARHAARFLLFWSPGDEANPFHPGDDGKARAVLAALADVPIVPVRTEALGELIAGLALCDRAILSDGGAMHIAAALGKPLLCFFGNSDAERWYPWGVRHELLQKPSRDVADISVDEALAAFERLN